MTYLKATHSWGVPGLSHEWIYWKYCKVMTFRLSFFFFFHFWFVIAPYVIQAPFEVCQLCFENPHKNVVTVRPGLKLTRIASSHSTRLCRPLVFIILSFLYVFHVCIFKKFHPLSGFLPHRYLFGFKHLTQSYGHRRKDQQVVCTNRPEVW